MRPHSKTLSFDELLSPLNKEAKDLFHPSDRVSTFEEYDNFKVLVLRRVILRDEKLSFLAECFVLFPSHVYYYDREEDQFCLLENSIVSMSSLLEGFYRENRNIMNGYFAEIERLEECLFDRKIPQYFMDLWFNVKRDLSRLENFYYRNIAIYREFLKRAEQELGNHLDDFKDIEHTIQFQSTHIATFKGRLDSLHHYFVSVKNERMNKTLLMLTVISGVFLPLNLIVGFFGMNTPGLYLSNDPEGSYKVLLLLGSVLIFCLVGIKLVRMVDQFFLRLFLGRFDFYKKLSTRISELDHRLRGK